MVVFGYESQYFEMFYLRIANTHIQPGCVVSIFIAALPEECLRCLYIIVLLSTWRPINMLQSFLLSLISTLCL